jgi:hypothetical protein
VPFLPLFIDEEMEFPHREVIQFTKTRQLLYYVVKTESKLRQMGFQPMLLAAMLGKARQAKFQVQHSLWPKVAFSWISSGVGAF